MKRVSTLLRGFFLLVCCLAVASLASGQNSKWGGWCYKDYGDNGTFTVPANCTQLYIEAVGAGGGGGNATKPSTSLATRTGTGGGGGAYARKHVTNPSGSYTITIGIGGGAAAAGVHELRDVGTVRRHLYLLLRADGDPAVPGEKRMGDGGLRGGPRV